MMFWIFPIKNDKYVFNNFSGKGYGDNPKYIAEEIAKRTNGKLVWLSKSDSEKYPDYIYPVKYNSIMMPYHLATARVWIFNTRSEPYFVKRKKQYYIQTWHGSLPLKKIERDVEESLNEFYVYTAKQDSRMIDLMISDSRFSDALYKESFWYEGDVKCLGTARLDALYYCRDTEEIKASLPIDRNSFIVLYAPTFRNNNRTDVYDLDYEGVVEALEKKVGKKVEILVKFHPNIKDSQIIKADRTRNVSSYPDVYELLKVSDALITDYSSLLFEFSVFDPKPVFLYAKDLGTYDRGFYFTADELPFSFAKTNEELLLQIKNFDKSSYEEKTRQFYKDMNLVADGHSSERIADYILERVDCIQS